MTSTYDRRQFLTHSAAAAGGVVAAGAVVGELGFAGEAGAATPVRGGTLKMGVISDQNGPFNPAHANMDTSGFCYARSIYDPLMVVGRDGKTVYPYLAAKLAPNKTYTQWTITARPGIKFHNSTPCDGDAIFANMQENFSSALTGPAVKALITGFTHVHGSNTVTVHTRHPWVTFPFTLAEQQICFIAEPSTLKATYSGNPIGTGPFVFKSWIKNYVAPFVATRNPSYWRTGLPYLDQVEFHPIPDGPTRFNALKSPNDLDIIHMTEGDITKQFRGLGGGYTSVVDYPARPVYAPSSNCFMMNTSKPPFNNINMRKGCAMALDPKQFVKTVDAGFSTPINGIFEKGSPYYKGSPYPKYNVAGAKKLIAKVPKSQRSPITLTYVAGSPAVLTYAQLFQQFMKNVGVTVNLNGVTQGTLIGDAIYGAYQIMTWAQFGGVSPDLNHPWFAVKPPGYPTTTWLNFARNQDPKIESLMISGMAAKSTGARDNAWAAVNIRINQDIPYLWTDRVVIGVAARSNVVNWQTFQDSASPPHAVLQPNQGVLFFTTTWKS